jgi:hypothetical protein
MSYANSDAPEMGLSSDLVYTRSKLNSVPARKQTFNFQSWNASTGGFAGGDTIKINISGGASQFLNTRASFLQLRVAAVGAGGELDGSAYSLIKTIAVYQGSTLVERLDNYGNWWNCLYQLQGNISSAGAGDGILYGTAAEVLSNGIVVGAGNLETALKLELGNAAFYECAKNAAEKEKDHYSFAKFKTLMKVEKEHAAAISKFLKISAPDLEKQACAAKSKINTQEGFERENRAIKSYTKFGNEAIEPRLKEFFSALVEIETDHLDLHTSNLK